MVGFKVKINKKELLNLIDSKLDEIADDIFANSQENIVNKNIIDEGTLLKSGNINRQFLDKEIIYSVPYADVIEFGRLPGSMPPVQPIQKWVQRKLNISDPKKANQIAWAISKDIKLHGLQPRPFLGPAIEKVKLERSL